MCSTYAKTTDTDNNDRRRSSSTGVDKELCVCVLPYSWFLTN